MAVSYFSGKIQNPKAIRTICFVVQNAERFVSVVQVQDLGYPFSFVALRCIALHKV